MFKIDISGAIYEADKVEILKQHLVVDNNDLGKVGFTFVAHVVEGEYNFINGNGIIRWESK